MHTCKFRGISKLYMEYRSVIFKKWLPLQCCLNWVWCMLQLTREMYPFPPLALWKVDWATARLKHTGIRACMSNVTVAEMELVRLTRLRIDSLKASKLQGSTTHHRTRNFPGFHCAHPISVVIILLWTCWYVCVHVCSLTKCTVVYMYVWLESKHS